MSETKQRIRVGDRVRVIVRGMFYGQVVEVLEVERTQGQWRSYQLAVNWDGIVRPSYFREDEFERVIRDEEKASE